VLVAIIQPRGLDLQGATQQLLSPGAVRFVFDNDRLDVFLRMFILQRILDLRHLAIHTLHRTLRLPLHPVWEAVAPDQEHPFIQFPAWVLVDQQVRYFIRDSVPDVVGHVTFRFPIIILWATITPHY